MVAKNSIAQIWWRDDDASRPTSNLDWMLKTIDSLEFKPLLAAIPNLSSRELAKALKPTVYQLPFMDYRTQIMNLQILENPNLAQVETSMI